MIGKTVGNYKIVSELGEGGMGAVYLAEHTLMGKQAAVKVLLPCFCAEKEVIERFFNEAKAASMIKHPGVVDIYDFCKQDDGSAFIVMELLEGEELTDLLEREVRIDSERVALIGQQIAGALQAAHDLGIVHRDLKPDNIFLEPDSAATGGVRPKVLDFGIAKLTGDISDSSVKTQAGAVMGTPIFMSPEQCTGEGLVDHRADIYSLGCILHLMICGRPPFVKNGAGALIAAHITETPAPLSRYEPSVIPNLEAIIMSTLSKNPDERPQSMQALANSLMTITGHTTSGSKRARTDPPMPDRHENMAAHEASERYAKTRVASGSPSPTTLGVTAGESTPGVYPAPAGGRRSSKPILIVGGLVVAAAAAFLVTSMAGDDKEVKTSVATAPAETTPSVKAPTETVEPEVSNTIDIYLQSEPEGAKVYNALTGVKLGTTPYSDEWNKERGELELMLKFDGYDPHMISVPLQKDYSQRFVLVSVKDAKAAAKEERRQDKKAGSNDPRKGQRAAKRKAKKAAERRIRDADRLQAKAERKARADVKKALAASNKAAADAKIAANKKAADKKATDKKPDRKWGKLAD